MPFIENFDEFKERQCCDCVLIRDSHVFANGAVARIDYRGEYELYEPSVEPIVLLQTKVNYTRAKLELMKENYARVHKGVMTQAEWHVKNYGPPPHEGVLKHLRESAVNIEALQNELAEMERQLPAKQHDATKQELDGKRSYEAKELFDSIQKLPIY